ncbi:hypothetical protein POM88_008449 [Heracleum sosnowskyi]|uniref:CCHC-type domain-containing protein n=1 Tax=Heracleum sosnowskyi TaxID=360622 RepID=A0AAD8J7E2_9APIA|nr:hypothetical protein POM88_008449 [Heracleum sosnowskyi]
MYQLEQEVNSLSQESLSIQEFYSAIMLLWNEMDMIEEKIPEAALETVLKLRLQTRARQFLMKLRQDFEPIRATILNRGGSSCVDTILPDLLVEETRLKSLSSHINVHDVALSATVQKAKTLNMSKIECFICHETSHIVIHCSKKKDTTGNVSTSLFCRYCKGEGHLIENCKIRPSRNRSHRAYMSSVPSTSEATRTLNQHHASQSNSPSPDFIQQVIQALQDSNIVHALQASNDLRTGKVIRSGHKKGELFVLDFDLPSSTPTSGSPNCFLAPSIAEINKANRLWRLWHNRLVHPHAFVLNSLFSSNALIDKLDHKSEIDKTCEECALS